MDLCWQAGTVAEWGVIKALFHGMAYPNETTWCKFCAHFVRRFSSLVAQNSSTMLARTILRCPIRFWTSAHLGRYCLPSGRSPTVPGSWLPVINLCWVPIPLIFFRTSAESAVLPPPLGVLQTIYPNRLLPFGNLMPTRCCSLFWRRDIPVSEKC